MSESSGRNLRIADPSSSRLRLKPSHGNLPSADRLRIQERTETPWNLLSDSPAALIDRLVHHCHIVNIRGNSYRLRQHAELARRLHAAPPPTTERRSRRQETATA